MQALRDLIKPERLTAIVNVGANDLGPKPAYQRMLEEGLCTVVGFEPLLDAIAKLDTGKGPNETYLPHAIGNGQQHLLHLTRNQGMVSFLEPDPKRLDLLHGFPVWGESMQLKPIHTVRLDDVSEVDHIDLLQADVQGYEIEVLRSGRHKLAEAVAIQVEVAFLPLYRNQPTLGDVDLELRGMGFLPHCFAGANVIPLRAPIMPPNNDPHQVVDADIFYVRDFGRPMATEQWKQLAMIAHHVCGSFDLAMIAVAAVAKAGGCPSDATQQYHRILEAM